VKTDLPILTAEYRGHDIETRQQVDKVSQRIKTSTFCQLHVEVGATGKGVTVRFFEGQDGLGIRRFEEVIKGVKRGDMLRISVMKYITDKGALSCNGDEIESVSTKPQVK